MWGVGRAFCISRVFVLGVLMDGKGGEQKGNRVKALKKLRIINMDSLCLKINRN